VVQVELSESFNEDVLNVDIVDWRSGMIVIVGGSIRLV
jgi:hypothetical protein